MTFTYATIGTKVTVRFEKSHQPHTALKLEFGYFCVEGIALIVCKKYR